MNIKKSNSKNVGLTINRETYITFSKYAKRRGRTVKSLLKDVMLYTVKNDLLKNEITKVIEKRVDDILSLE